MMSLPTPGIAGGGGADGLEDAVAAEHEQHVVAQVGSWAKSRREQGAYILRAVLDEEVGQRAAADKARCLVAELPLDLQHEVGRQSVAVGLVADDHGHALGNLVAINW